MAFVAAVAAGGASAYQAWQTKKFKEAEAAGYDEAGRRVMAAGTRDFQEEQRNREFMYSRALAVAAASGGGVDTPSMVKVLGDLQAEGQYRSYAKLWRAQNDAEGLQFRADAARREAKAAVTAGVINTVTSAVSAYASAGGSFGGSTPPPSLSASSSPLMSPIPPGSGAPSILERYRGP